MVEPIPIPADHVPTWKDILPCVFSDPNALVQPTATDKTTDKKEVDTPNFWDCVKVWKKQFKIPPNTVMPKLQVYSVSFEPGPLGIIIIPLAGRIVVQKVNSTKNESAPQPGHIMVGINFQMLPLDAPYQQVVQYLKQARSNPTVIAFAFDEDFTSFFAEHFKQGYERTVASSSAIVNKPSVAMVSPLNAVVKNANEVSNPPVTKKIKVEDGNDSSSTKRKRSDGDDEDAKDKTEHCSSSHANATLESIEKQCALPLQNRLESSNNVFDTKLTKEEIFKWRRLYFRFMILKGYHNDYDGMLFCPTKYVDAVWRCHLLDTRSYMDFCRIITESYQNKVDDQSSGIFHREERSGRREQTRQENTSVAFYAMWKQYWASSFE